MILRKMFQVEVFILCFVGCFLSLKAEYVTVQTEYGAVRGETNITRNGTQYNRFLGIPYAQPPLGELRYKPPQPPAAWSGERDALEVASDCPAWGDFSEDCLYLNVFVPDGSEQSPVLVWIYGGMYTWGSSSPLQYAPDYFLEHGVVFVDFNYRAGAIGFLSLQNEDIPGNVGLKDMVFALQWIQRNVAAFGGDPDQVTIMGHSSGASAAAHLFVSPASAGLYRAAIIMSGQAVALWGLELNPRDRAYRLAASMGFQGDSDAELAAFLLAANHTDLTKDDSRALTDEESRYLSTLAWLPVIEPASESAIIVESPAAILKEGRFNQVPLLTGVASAEGSVNVGSSGALTDPARAADLNENFTLLVGSQLQLPTEQERTEAAQRIEDFYFGEQGFTADKPQEYYDLCTDMIWLEPTEWMVKTVSNLSNFPVFYYYYDYNGTGSTEFGVPHGGEQDYLFTRDSVIPEQDPDSLDSKVQKLMITAWTNFISEPAPGGSPVLWEPYTTEAHNYLEITNEFVQRQDPVKERMDFWEETVPFIVWPVETTSGAAALMDSTTVRLAVLLCAVAARIIF